ncbi:MAG TPA: hydroxymethylglutaryl-CoA synthase [Anaerolineae bacterium]|nr:hydroxymethylglutaryl-CoA synthase [Anaerolineae bacterium]MCB0222107.1 hydroxymethylglutaryl-CoA synthase [Anaerolineae bacterium]HRV90985.1 hydroxymethylglutaryl-CoA synthase [Anaerolineae bacterium]
MMPLMKPNTDVGIVGYGCYIPMYRLPAKEVTRIWNDGQGGVPIKEKAVGGPDEDTMTIGLEAARNALARAQIDPQQIGAVWVGSESHPYAVKPTSTIIAEAIGATPATQGADWQFACKAGTETIQAGIGFVAGGMARYVLGIGADTAQGRPGDALEFTAASGGAAFVIGAAEESLAVFEATYSHVTDTPDFWRRPTTHYPSHGQRFTGEPAYFHHVLSAAQTIMAELGYTAQDFAYVILHQPNRKFPERAAAELGFEKEQWVTGLLSPVVGNTYAGASVLGLTAVLDIAQPGDKILCVSFGSGAGSDAFIINTTDRLPDKQKSAPTTQDYINRRIEIDYATYVRYRNKLKMH